MTKKELLKQLEAFDDNIQIIFQPTMDEGMSSTSGITTDIISMDVGTEEDIFVDMNEEDKDGNGIEYQLEGKLIINMTCNKIAWN